MDQIIELLTNLKRRLERLERNTALDIFVLPKSSSAPSSPVAGQAYYNTSTNKAQIYNGTTWNDLW